MDNDGEPQGSKSPFPIPQTMPSVSAGDSGSEKGPESLDVLPGCDAIPLARPVAFAHPAKPAPDIHLMDESRSAAWIDIVIFLFLFISLDTVGGILIVYAHRWLSGAAAVASADLRAERALVVPMLAWRAALAVLLVGVIVRHRRGNARSVGVTSGSLLLDFLIALGAAMAAGLVVVAVMSALEICFQSLAAQLEENGRRIMDRVPKGTPVMFALVTLLVGLWEELVFRGFLMPRLRRATGSWAVAVVLSTTVFAVPHLIDQVAAALVPVTVLSLMFSLVTIWRRSIVPAVVAHTLFDFGMFLQLYYLAGDQWK